MIFMVCLANRLLPADACDWRRPSNQTFVRIQFFVCDNPIRKSHTACQLLVMNQDQAIHQGSILNQMGRNLHIGGMVGSLRRSVDREVN
jgi:hypothetical protein